MVEIQLTQRKIALVDDEDYERIRWYRWSCSNNANNSYAVRSIKIGYHKYKMWKMHWDVIGKPKKGFKIDHIDGDGLNNQKSNLRVCTNAENGMNRGKNKNNTSGYKGVFYTKTGKRLKKWIARIKVNGKDIFLGYFLNKIDAAKAYNGAAVKYHKEFAKLNIIK